MWRLTHCRLWRLTLWRLTLTTLHKPSNTHVLGSHFTRALRFGLQGLCGGLLQAGSYRGLVLRLLTEGGG